MRRPFEVSREKLSAFDDLTLVKLIVEVIEPYHGLIYDPACGSGGMFVQSAGFVERHKLNPSREISIYGQEKVAETVRLCKMNLAVHGLSGDIRQSNTYYEDIHNCVGKFDFVMANPPFNDSDWGGDKLAEDVRWKYGVPPAGNANFAWVQHFIHHLAPEGLAGFVLANGSMSTSTSGEGEIRKAIIEADLVDCMVALPGQLFYTTPIPVCLWFLTRNKHDKSKRDRRGQTLFIRNRISRLYGLVHMNCGPLHFQFSEDLGLMML